MARVEQVRQRLHCRVAKPAAHPRACCAKRLHQARLLCHPCEMYEREDCIACLDHRKSSAAFACFHSPAIVWSATVNLMTTDCLPARLDRPVDRKLSFLCLAHSRVQYPTA